MKISPFRTSIGALFCFCLGSVCIAAPDLAKTEGAPGTEAWTHEVVQQGIYAFLHGQEREGIAFLTRVKNEAIERSEGPYLLAYVRWVKAREIGYKGSREAEENFQIFSNETQEAINRATAVYKKNPTDAQNLLFLAASHGYRTQFHLEREEYWRAFLDSIPAKRYLQQTVKADPKLVDANLGMGMHEYYVATLPKILKMLTFLRGDKEKGLALMAHAAREGIYVRPEAAWLLQDLLCMKENRCAEALPQIEKLSGLFPENVQMALGLEKVYMRLGRYEEARRVSERLLARIGQRQVPTSWVPYIRYRIAMTMTYGGQAQIAIGQYRELLENPDVSVDLKGWVRLRLANALDIEGQREQAVSEYQEILDGNDISSEISQAARRHLDIAWKNGDKPVAPKPHFLGMTPLTET